jgi:hypothetical protein
MNAVVNDNVDNSGKIKKTTQIRGFVLDRRMEVISLGYLFRS